MYGGYCQRKKKRLCSEHWTEMFSMLTGLIFTSLNARNTTKYSVRGAFERIQEAADISRGSG